MNIYHNIESVVALSQLACCSAVSLVTIFILTKATELQRS